MWSKSAGGGIPIVLIHGAFSDYRYWELQQIVFGRQYRAIAVSLCGYYPAESLPAGEYVSAEKHVEDVGKLLADLGEPVHLLGHSRGGRIGLHVAARFAPRIRSLVLVEPGGILASNFLAAGAAIMKSDAVSNYRAQAGDLIAQGKLSAGLQLYVDSGHGAGAWERSPEIFRRVALSNARSIFGMLSDTTAPLSRDVARQVRCPTLLVGGDKSPPLFSSILDVLEGLIPNSSRIVIAGGDHFLNLTKQREFDNAVLEFLVARRP